MPRKILLIEDEERLAGHVQLWLEQVGYECTSCISGTRGLEKAAQWTPDLVILDLALPGLDGWEVCRRLRQTSQVPIIMVTARAEEMDRVRGLKMGADDYVVKPFSLPELVARVEAVLRRAGSADRDRADRLYHADRLDVDLEEHKVWVDRSEIKLTPTEFRLLAYMIQHQGHLLTHRQILQAVWGPEYVDDIDSLRMFVRALRRKIEIPDGPGGAGQQHITTEYGVGYRFQ
jgi:two-component system KDP operon response regulator KdpE